MTDQFNLGASLQKYATSPESLNKPELILLYGQPGCGKTHLAGTIAQVPEVKRVLYLDTEGSTVGVLTRLPKEAQAKVQVIRVDKQENPFAFLNTIIAALDGGDESYGSDDVIIIDTFDVAQDWAEAHFKANAPVSRSGEKDGFWAWGEIGRWSLNVAMVLKKIAPICILVLHDKEEKAASGALTKRLRLSGDSKNTLPGKPDMVVYLERKVDGDSETGATTYAIFGTDDNKVTKDRFNLPSLVKDVTMPGIFNFISNSIKDKGDD